MPDPQPRERQRTTGPPPPFKEVWDSLGLDPVQARIDPGQTVTQDLLDQLLGTEPPPESQAPLLHPRLASLPLLLADGPGALGHDLRLGHILGVGGMGVVHVGRQDSLDREVAVKRLTRLDAPAIDALLREAAITGSLEHPNIVPVHALGCDAEGRPVLVMKRIEGRKWRSELLPEHDPARSSSMELERQIRVLMEVCHALHYAHSRGVVHLDLKPDNVMIGEFGEVLLVDWGVAMRFAEPRTRAMVGTPAYMAPELVSDEPVDPRTDVYLLGASLHVILTGVAPHQGENLYAVLHQAWHSDVPVFPPDVPDELAILCAAAMSRDPAQRPPTALAFREALEGWLRHRNSRELSDAALAQLAQLKQGTLSDSQNRVTLGNACRFGLQNALSAWEGNTQARDGLVQCLEVLVDIHLERGAPDEAATVLTELDALAPTDDPGRASLRAHVERRVRRQQALNRLGRELDMTVSGAPRELFLVAMWLGAMVVNLALVAALRVGWLRLDHATGVLVCVGVLMVLQLALLLGRKRVLANVADRRIMYTMLLGAWAVLVHRVEGWLLDVPVDVVWAQDLLLLAVVTGVAGITVSRAVLGIAVMLLVLGLVAAWTPAWAVEILCLGVSAACFALALVFLRWVR